MNPLFILSVSQRVLVSVTFVLLFSPQNTDLFSATSVVFPFLFFWCFLKLQCNLWPETKKKVHENWSTIKSMCLVCYTSFGFVLIFQHIPIWILNLATQTISDLITRKPSLPPHRVGFLLFYTAWWEMMIFPGEQWSLNCSFILFIYYYYGGILAL